MNIRLFAIIGAVLTALLAIDGIYMIASGYNGNETQNFHLLDGTTILIAASILLVVTIIAFVMASRANASGVVQVPVAPDSEIAEDERVVPETTNATRKETIG